MSSKPFISQINKKESDLTDLFGKLFRRLWWRLRWRRDSLHDVRNKPTLGLCSKNWPRKRWYEDPQDDVEGRSLQSGTWPMSSLYNVNKQLSFFKNVNKQLSLFKNVSNQLSLFKNVNKQLSNLGWTWATCLQNTLFWYCEAWRTT